MTTAKDGKAPSSEGATVRRHKGVVDTALTLVTYKGEEMTRAEALNRALWDDALQGKTWKHRKEARAQLIPLLFPDATKLVDVEKVAQSSGGAADRPRVVRFIRDETRAKPSTRQRVEAEQPAMEDDE